MMIARALGLGLIGLLAPGLLAAGALERAQGSAWPKGFAARVTDTSSWTEHQVNGGALRFRVLLPPGWKPSILPPSDDQIFTAFDLSQGLQVMVDSVTPTSFKLDQLLPSATVEEATTAMRGALGERGYDVTSGGQVQAGRQVWLWQEARMQPAALGSYAKVMSVGSGSVWLFTATPRGYRVTLRCVVLHPTGATAADLEQKTSLAGGIFAAVLERLVVEEK